MNFTAQCIRNHDTGIWDLNSLHPSDNMCIVTKRKKQLPIFRHYFLTPTINQSILDFFIVA